jgi:hypothetical protein
MGVKYTKGTCTMGADCIDAGPNSPDISPNRVRATGIAASGIGRGVFECVASTRLSSRDPDDSPVMDLPTSGVPSYIGYTYCPGAIKCSYATGAYPHGAAYPDGRAVDLGGSGRVMDDPELPVETVLASVVTSYASMFWP